MLPVDTKNSQSFYEWFDRNRDRVVQEVAIPAIKEACVGLTLAAATSYFVTTPLGLATLGLYPVYMTITNIFFRSFNLYCQDEKVDFWGFEWVLSYLPAINFSTLDLSTRQVLIHEGGHYFAVKLFYKNVRATIEVFPLLGGETKYWNIRGLTEWGKKLGHENTRAAVAAAGTLATMATGIPTLITGHYLGGELGKYLQAFVFVSALGDVTYALLALLSNKPSGSDFEQLKKFGIHPVVSAATILLIPLTLKGMLFLIDRLKKEESFQ